MGYAAPCAQQSLAMATSVMVLDVLMASSSKAQWSLLGELCLFGVFTLADGSSRCIVGMDGG
eukprot:NODE_4551_length_1878_cov_3.431182.p10 GENE.NODE_4551_length_1878_cov_3.431182~~NODE_4551_length_1878_cov_3.431182.p10  ORF type:complete len:62 (-),score=7.20 NODE_4551_length_1878_cov_3.431182:791-976(-)